MIIDTNSIGVLRVRSFLCVVEGTNTAAIARTHEQINMVTSDVL